MKCISSAALAGVAMLLCVGCDSPQGPAAPSNGSDSSASPAVTAGDRLSGLSLGKDEYARYLSVREPDELRALAGRPEQLREIALDYHSDVVLARHAEAQGLADSPLVQERMARARRDILLQALADRLAAEQDYPPPEVLEQRALEQYQRTLDDAFTIPGGRRVAHILVSEDNCRVRGTGTDPEGVIAELQKRLEAGADFSALAEEFSDDATWRSGGVLPRPVRRDGQTAKPFEDAVFALSEVGEVSAPVRTRFGLHLIQLREIQEPRVVPFEEVRESLLAQERNRILFSEQEKLRAAAYPDPQAIDVEALVVIAENAARGAGEAP